MGDADLFARIPEAGSSSGPRSIEEILARFDEEREVEFKGDVYLVRDNGAVMRRARAGARRRKLDEVWTFGSLNKHSGYLVISEHVVHQIVACAFRGARPSADYVVDHVDTNRLNNRAENLRWVTRLENVLLNPITRRRIELAFGSLDAFFANPGARTVPNLEWMRTVTKEEADRSLERLLVWAESGADGKGGRLGDWVFSVRGRIAPDREAEPQDAISPTPNAFQRKWRTVTEFPQCPEVSNADALTEYLRRLTFGTVFARNRYGESCVVVAGQRADGGLSVLSRTPTGVKSWTIARVFAESGGIFHEAGGTFFTLQGALKAHCKETGEEYAESIDDYA